MSDIHGKQDRRATASETRLSPNARLGTRLAIQVGASITEPAGKRPPDRGDRYRRGSVTRHDAIVLAVAGGVPLNPAFSSTRREASSLYRGCGDRAVCMDPDEGQQQLDGLGRGFDHLVVTP